jgi:hypothetical protein
MPWWIFVSVSSSSPAGATPVRSRYVRSPRIVLSVPAVLIMIPGATAFRALVFLNEGQITLALANGAQAAIIVASLAAGLTIARVVTDPSWTQPRFEHVAGQPPANRGRRGADTTAPASTTTPPGSGTRRTYGRDHLGCE